MASDYSKDRYAFGRSIGSYQSIKHRLVEMVRLIENARSLLYRVAWADGAGTLADLAISASAARSAAVRACDFATDRNLYVHGAIGATWEHDGHLLFRRAQLSRRLLGGGDGASLDLALLMLRDAEARPQFV
jgi:alkylation response protein AidB-like acyl-CoA dehydrogenase